MDPCVKYEEWMSASVDGMLDDAEQVELMVHLQTCPSCLAIWQDYELMSKALKYAEVEPPATLVVDVMAKIQAQPVLTARRGGGARRFMAIAAVFAVVAFVGLYTFWGPMSAEDGESSAIFHAEPAVPRVEAAIAEAEEAIPRQAVESWTDDPSEDDIAELEDYGSLGFGELMEHGAAADILPESTLFDLFFSRESLGDWDELREQLIGGGYGYEVEDGVFVAHDPYRPGGYLYGMLIDDRSYPGHTIVTRIGYAYRTEGVYRRVELRTVDGEVRYYYDVRYAGGAGTRVDTLEQIRVFLFG